MSKLNENRVLMRYRMRYRKARSKKERSAILDEFILVTGIKCRKHAIRLLSGKSKPTKDISARPGRKRVYDSPS